MSSFTSSQPLPQSTAPTAPVDDTVMVTEAEVVAEAELLDADAAAPEKEVAPPEEPPKEPKDTTRHVTNGGMDTSSVPAPQQQQEQPSSSAEEKDGMFTMKKTAIIPMGNSAGNGNGDSKNGLESGGNAEGSTANPQTTAPSPDPRPEAMQEDAVPTEEPEEPHSSPAPPGVELDASLEDDIAAAAQAISTPANNNNTTPKQPAAKSLMKNASRKQPARKSVDATSSTRPKNTKTKAAEKVPAAKTKMVAKKKSSPMTYEGRPLIAFPGGQGQDWPAGWIERKFSRSSGETQGREDSYWYTPQLQVKLRSGKEVQRFIKALEQCKGDEAEAKKIYKQTQL